MIKTSRQRLLDYLEKKQVATARDISSALKMTPANARHHLSILLDQGSVEIVGKRPGPGRGRPHNLYQVAKYSSTNNINNLVNALIQELYTCATEQNSENTLRVIANRLAKGEIPENLNPTQRLNQAVAQLNLSNYEARWEAHMVSPRMIFNNCPYLSIVEDTPEICYVDKYILEKMLGLTVSQIAKLEFSPSGLKRCIFTLQNN